MLVFVQGAADETKHTLHIDEIGISNGQTVSNKDTLPKVQNLRAKGSERHIDLTWDPVDDPRLGRYVISRSLNGPFRRIGIQVPGVQRYADFLGKLNTPARYTVTAEDTSYHPAIASDAAGGATSAHLSH